MQAVILKARSYNFTDQNTNREVSGFRFNYIPLGMAKESGALGVSYVVEKGCSDISFFSNVLSVNPVPGVYDISFDGSYNRQGNLVERPVGFKFSRPCKLEDFGL